MLAASNLETVKQLQFRNKPQLNQFGEEVVSDFFNKVNDQLVSQDRQNIRRILGLYFNLFEINPEIFSKETTK
jgi:hypothetical protein